MQLRDIPVSVELDGLLAVEVAAYLEAEVGWRVVAPAGPPTPLLALTAVPSGDRACVVVVEGRPDPEVVRRGLLAGALDVIGWPDDRARLPEVVARLPRRPAQERATPILRVAAAAGGAGASTVALALGGLAAWSGRTAAVVGADDLMRLCGLPAWSGPGAAELAALDPVHASAEVERLCRPVRGVPGLLVLGGGGAAADPRVWPLGLVVADLRAADPAAGGADLVVARPDAGLLRLADLPEPPPVLLVGDGPLDRARVRRGLGDAVVGWLPHSARVARAGLAGRVPAGLPGTWLGALGAALSQAVALRGTPAAVPAAAVES